MDRSRPVALRPDALDRPFTPTLSVRQYREYAASRQKFAPAYVSALREAVRPSKAPAVRQRGSALQRTREVGRRSQGLRSRGTRRCAASRGAPADQGEPHQAVLLALLSLLHRRAGS